MFTDPDGVAYVRLDPAQEVEWKRPSEFFQLDPESEEKIVVVADKTKSFDLVKSNQHLRDK